MRSFTEEEGIQPPIVVFCWRGASPARKNFQKFVLVLLCLAMFGQTPVPGEPRQSESSADPRIDEQYREATEQFRLGNIQAAVARLQGIIQRAPRFYYAFNLLGVCYEKLGDHTKANQAFVRALQINPRFDKARVNLGTNYVTLGRIPEGLDEFRKATELNPRSVSAFFNLGYTELERGQPARAVGPLKKAYRLSGRDPTILAALVSALIKSGQLGEALQYGGDSSRRRPLDPRQELQLGLIFLGSRQCQAAQQHLRAAGKANSTLRDQMIGLGEKAFDERKYSEALCLFDVAIELGPEAASLHSIAGACHYQLKNPAEAVAEVQRAIRLDPQNEEYYVQLAQIFIDFNTPDAAILLLEPALNIFPSSGRIRFVLGVACLKAFKVEEARQYLGECLRMQPQNLLALRALATLYEGESHWDSLLEVAKSFEQLPSHRYEGYYYQAEATYNLFRSQPEHYPEVESLLRTSISLEPGFSPSHLLLGKLLLEKESYSEAVGSFKRAIALDPESTSAYYNLAIAYGKLGESDKRTEAFKQVQALSQKEKKSPDKSLLYEVVREPSPRN